MRARLKYGITGIILLAIEILIAKFGSGVVRGYVGDVLVIPLIYFLLRAVLFPRNRVFSVYVLPFLTYLLGWVAEVLQAFHLIDHLGIDAGSPLGIALGGVFDLRDGLCYYLGLLLIGLYLAVETHWMAGHRGAIRRAERRSARQARRCMQRDVAQAEATADVKVNMARRLDRKEKVLQKEDDRRWFYPVAVFIQWTWGIIQTLAGFVVFLRYIKSPHRYFKGVVQTVWPSGAGLSLGMFIFTPEEPAPDDQSERAKRERRYCAEVSIHEYGHTFQSILLGPLFLLVVGLPSAIWAGSKRFSRMRREKHIPYSSLFCEHWASSWGEKVTKEKADWT